ncbi:hypothetical protein [Roseobacter sp. HKCCA0434]|uniref:hypothetical protein n=1 Tax=Roseobacter sp. HKCCA0434 TaxID=3079297 RepID=UPI0029058EC1|nr:hypothetical protein [Roseobacter sp. HKCCA0434]
MIDPIPTAPPRLPQQSAPTHARAQQLALEFEAAFLAEMLSHASFGAPRQVAGGGAGEDAFASLLAREQARDFASNGGLGLAGKIAESLLRRDE